MTTGEWEVTVSSDVPPRVTNLEILPVAEVMLEDVEDMEVVKPPGEGTVSAGARPAYTNACAIISFSFLSST